MANGLHCTILALGSRGDVQPLLALGLGLKAAGYGVRFAAAEDFEGWVRELGLDYVRLTGNSTRFFAGPAGMAMRERLRDKREFVRFFDDYLGIFVEKMFKACWEACQDTDAVLCWSWTRIGPSLSEKLGVPLFVVSPNPVLHLPTFAFANPFQGPGDLPLGSIYNRLTWLLANPFTRIGQNQVNVWREKSLGLAPLSWSDELRQLRRLPHLLGYSPSVLPKPWDWGDDISVTGYWFLDQPIDYVPPPHLSDFLAAADPPVAVGFSSQISRDTKRITTAVIDGLRQSGKRGILISGWGGLKGIDLPDDICRIDSVPYDWLLPRISAMIHHGGSGSVSAALRAGVPSFAVPFGYEQKLWGQRIARLGVGVEPITPDRLTANTLAVAIRRIADDERIRKRADIFATTIRAEDGIGVAVGIIERTMDAHRRTHTARAVPSSVVRGGQS